MPTERASRRLDELKDWWEGRVDGWKDEGVDDWIGGLQKVGRGRRAFAVALAQEWTRRWGEILEFGRTLGVRCSFLHETRIQKSRQCRIVSLSGILIFKMSHVRLRIQRALGAHSDRETSSWACPDLSDGP